MITIQQTPTGTVLRWVMEQQVLYLAGKVPEVWLQLLRDQGYQIQQVS